MSTRGQYVRSIKKKQEQNKYVAPNRPIVGTPGVGKNSVNPIIREASGKGLAKPVTKKTVPVLTNPLKTKPKRNPLRRNTMI